MRSSRHILYFLGVEFGQRTFSELGFAPVRPGLASERTTLCSIRSRLGASWAFTVRFGGCELEPEERRRKKKRLAKDFLRENKRTTLKSIF